jgi:hypothetical protein
MKKAVFFRPSSLFSIFLRNMRYSVNFLFLGKYCILEEDTHTLYVKNNLYYYISDRKLTTINLCFWSATSPV